MKHLTGIVSLSKYQIIGDDAVMSETLFDLKEIKVTSNKNWTFDIMDALTAPIISYPSPWKDTISAKVKDKIIIERMIALMKKEKTATMAECVAYLYPASLTFPLNDRWANIYLYVASQYCKNSGKEVPEDIKVETLNSYEMEILEDLRRFIYRKRREYVKDRLRSERKETETVEEVIPIQPQLFGGDNRND